MVDDDTSPETPYAKRFASIREAVHRLHELVVGLDAQQRQHQMALERLAGHLFACMLTMSLWLICVTVWALLRG